MAFHQADLRAAAGRARSGRTKIAKDLGEARRQRQDTAFLCHSHRDGELALGLQAMLREQGWDVYLDWQDESMPAQPNGETADRIQAKIRNLRWFIFLATENSVASRWCPWEIGFADAAKTRRFILLVRTHDSRGWYGNEYLNLYREITTTNTKNVAVFNPGQRTGGVLVKNL